jgi:polysaccharide deacetylase 2 family uncharacterized protein YibQ
VNVASDKLKSRSGAAVGAARPLTRVGWAALALALPVAAALLVLTRPPSGVSPFADATIRVRPEAAAPAAEPAPQEAAAPLRLVPAPDSRLVEHSPYGMLPRIGEDGSRPSQVYARPAGAPPTNGPRIALVVGGLGISRNLTAEAIAKLPPAVTLAFAPYGEDLDALVSGAREDGHEVLLQVPMEPFDYPDSDPGPHTLTAGARARENIDRLHWVMGRFTGYVGLVNLMGAKLTADRAALAPVLEEIGSRGLLVLDDGASAASVLASGAPPEVPARRADIALDLVPRPEAIDGELNRAKGLAREKGLVIVTASALPATLDRIAGWASALETEGIRLVPVSLAIQGHTTR